MSKFKVGVFGRCISKEHRAFYFELVTSALDVLDECPCGSLTSYACAQTGCPILEVDELDALIATANAGQEALQGMLKSYLNKFQTVLRLGVSVGQTTGAYTLYERKPTPDPRVERIAALRRAVEGLERIDEEPNQMGLMADEVVEEYGLEAWNTAHGVLADLERLAKGKSK